MIGSEADVRLSGGDEMQRRRRSLSGARAGDHGDRDGGRRRRAQQDCEAGSASENWTHQPLIFSSDDGRRDRNPGSEVPQPRRPRRGAVSRGLVGVHNGAAREFCFA